MMVEGLDNKAYQGRREGRYEGCHPRIFSNSHVQLPSAGREDWEDLPEGGLEGEIQGWVELTQTN